MARASRESGSESELVREVIAQFRAAYLAKENEGLHRDWADFEEYWAGRSNPPEDEDDPGSENNIILPVIESQIADLVEQPMDVLVKGIEPSDHMYAHDVKTVLEWVLDRNNMPFKLDEHERDRLKFGTGIWKVWFDPNALNRRGLPIIEPVCPANFFPDPKVKRAWQLDDADFVCHAVYRSLNNLKLRFGDRANDVLPEGFTQYNMDLFKGDYSDMISKEVNDKALLIERWTLEMDKEEGRYLRLVCVAGNKVLYDSNWDAKARGYKGYYKKPMYPFVMTPCYARKGQVWGMGDVELLRPVQDLINDLDDQIRMNARLMGNLQMVVGLASGINIKKWTNKPGLKIPARDPDAWRMVEPPNIPSFIPLRRQEAKLEAQEYSGRTDAVEGRKPGGVRAASAIIALQEAGGRRVNHKKLLLQQGLSRVLELVVNLIAEHYTEEMAFRIIGSKSDDYLWFRGSELNAIPKLIPGIDGELVPLMTEDGSDTVKKVAEFDLSISIGAGLPHNKSFLYQAVVELHREGLLTLEEGRLFLKNIMSFPIIDPLNPIGQFTGRNLPPETAAMMNGQIPDEFSQMMPGPEDIPPDVLNNLAQLLGGGNRAA